MVGREGVGVGGGGCGRVVVLITRPCMMCGMCGITRLCGICSSTQKTPADLAYSARCWIAFIDPSLVTISSSAWVQGSGLIRDADDRVGLRARAWAERGAAGRRRARRAPRRWVG